MPRFFAPEFSADTARFILSGDESNHIKVLRLKAGDTVTVCDGRKTDYTCSITELRPGYCAVEKISSAPTAGEPELQAWLFAAFSKSDKMDGVVQKAVELGCAGLTVFPSKRCVAVPDSRALERRLQRWNKISAEAACQCGRGIIPPVSAAPDFQSALSAAMKSSLAVFLYEDERKSAFKSVLSGSEPRSVSLITGPEGGFEPEEAAAAIEAGCVSASLGPRILRCETAPLCALSALMFHTDNL